MNKAELIKALAELLAEKMEIGEEPTNGEVIQAVFSDCVLSIDEYGWHTMNIDGYVEFTPEWWNAPYKRGDEE